MLKYAQGRMGKMSKKFFISLILFCTVVLFLTACGTQKDAPDEEGKDTVGDTLIIGMSCDNPPFGWLQEESGEDTIEIDGEDGYVGGYDAAIANTIAEELDVDISVKIYDRSDLIEAVEDGDIDLLIAGVNPLDKRAERIDFSDAYYENEYVVIVLKSGAYANEVSIEGFQNARLTAQNGSYIYDELLPQIKNAEIMPAMTFHKDMRVALNNNVIDGYVTTLPEGMSATILHPEYAMIIFNEDQGFETDEEFSSFAVGMAKDRTELMDAVNAAIATISPEERKVLMDRAVYAEPKDLEEADKEEK